MNTNVVKSGKVLLVYEILISVPFNYLKALEFNSSNILTKKLSALETPFRLWSSKKVNKINLAALQMYVVLIQIFALLKLSL